MVDFKKILTFCTLLLLYTPIKAHCGLGFSCRGRIFPCQRHHSCYRDFPESRHCHNSGCYAHNNSCSSSSCYDSYDDDEEECNYTDYCEESLEIVNKTPHTIKIQDQDGNGIILDPNQRTAIVHPKDNEFTVIAYLGNNKKKKQTFTTQATAITIFIDEKNNLRIKQNLQNF